MTVRLVAILTCAVALSACATTATMVPVDGPMSKLKPVPVLQVRADGIMGNSGNLSTTLPDGAQCSGRWASAAGAGISYGSATLIGQYGTAYLSGYSVSTGTGQNPGQAILTCTDGRTIQVEFVTGAGTANGFGIAKDSEDNIFRLVF